MHLVDLNLGQRKSSQWVDAPWHGLVGAVDQHSAGVDHINNHDQFSVISTIVNVANPTWLHEIIKTLETRKKTVRDQYVCYRLTTQYGVFCLPAIRII